VALAQAPAHFPAKRLDSRQIVTGGFASSEQHGLDASDKGRVYA